MNNSNIDKLLESLNDITYQSKEVLQEESTTIVDRILHIQNALSGNIGGTSTVKISANDREMIDKVKKIRLNYEYRILTYPNIHNSNKYDIQAQCNIQYVLDAICEHIDHPDKEFNSKRVNEEAIAKTFHKLTGQTYNDKTMSLDEFREEYQSVAFGGFRKVLVIPNVIQLTRLYERSPFIVSYINNRLISEHINNLNRYYKDVEDKFNKMARNNAEISISLNKYLECLETGIRNTLVLYKAIRSIFLELNAEYKNIFNQLLDIDRDLSSKSLNESMTLFYNTLFNKIDNLTENINYEKTLIETTQQNNSEELSNNIESKSFKSFIEYFINESKINRSAREIFLSKTKEIYGIISNISNDDLAKINGSYRIYSNIINKIDMSDFISVINNKIDFCKTQFDSIVNNEEKLNTITKDEVFKELIADISLCNIPNLSESNMVGCIMDNIRKTILGTPIISKINNLNNTFDNILNIPNYCEIINQHLIKLDDFIKDLLISNNKINNDKTKLVNIKIIKAYIAYSSVISCIFYTLMNFENKSLELVQTLINDI